MTEQMSEAVEAARGLLYELGACSCLCVADTPLCDSCRAREVSFALALALDADEPGSPA